MRGLSAKAIHSAKANFVRALRKDLGLTPSHLPHPSPLLPATQQSTLVLTMSDSIWLLSAVLLSSLVTTEALLKLLFLVAMLCVPSESPPLSSIA